MLFFLHVLAFKASILPLNDNYINDQVLTIFIDGFANEESIQNWMKCKNLKSLPSTKLFKRILSDIRDVLLVINTEQFSSIKSLMKKAEMIQRRLSCLYLKSWIIMESINWILNLNEINYALNVDDYQRLHFNEFLLYSAYDFIKENFDSAINYVGELLNEDGNLNYTLKVLDKWSCNGYDDKYLTETSKKILVKIINLLELSNDVFEFILPVKKENPIFIFANSQGIKRSRKSFGDKVCHFNKSRSKKILSGKNVKYCKKTSKAPFGSNVELKEHVNKTYLCNKASAILLMTLFHWYSETKERHTTYKIIFENNDEYKIEWSFYGESPAERAKKKFLNQEIEDLSKKKIIYKFGQLIDYHVEHTTLKPDEFKDEPIETRLILLSCGHQLGLDLIDEFFESCYDIDYKSSVCHICRVQIDILGSYDAIVYRCK